MYHSSGAEVFARCHAAGSAFRSRLSAPPADACALLRRGRERRADASAAAAH